MSNKKKVTDLVAVDDYYSNADDEYSYGGYADVPALDYHPNVTDLATVENYSNVDDEYPNSRSGTTHEEPVPENDPLDEHEVPSYVPNCVLKLNKRPKESAASIKELIRRKLRVTGKKIFMISVNVEENTVAICGFVNPATVAWKVSDCAGVGATLVFFKERPTFRPPYCKSTDFRIHGKYCKLVRKELQKMKGINSVIVDSSSPDSRVRMSISGDCFNVDDICKKIKQLCHCHRDIKVLSKKTMKHIARDFETARNITDTFEITVDFIVPHKHGRECAIQINEMLLDTKGVNFVTTYFCGTGLASVNVYGDNRLDLDTITEIISDAGGIKSRLRKSLISQLIFAFCG